jgi:hypothetical protein
LTNYSSAGAQMFTGNTTAASTLAFRTTTQASGARPKVLTKSSDGVHVQVSLDSIISTPSTI